MVYFRYKDADSFVEELLICSPHQLKSRGIDVFNKANVFFNAQSLKCENLTNVCLYGAPPLLDYINGFSVYVKKE